MLEPRLVGRGVLLADEQEHERLGVAPHGVQRVAEAPPRPCDALARGLLGDREHLAELAQRQAGVEAQEEHEAVVRRQLGERGARGAVVVLRRGRVEQAVELLDGGDRPARAAAQLVDREVRGGAVQPRGDRGRGHLARRRPPRAHEDLLAEVLGDLRVAGHPGQAAAQERLLLGEDALEGHLYGLYAGTAPDRTTRR
jgi:hypothetical protein